MVSTNDAKYLACARLRMRTGEGSPTRPGVDIRSSRCLAHLQILNLISWPDCRQQMRVLLAVVSKKLGQFSEIFLCR